MNQRLIAQIYIPKEGAYALVESSSQPRPQVVPSESELERDLQFLRSLGAHVFTVGFLVKHFREQRGWTQRKLQEESGLPHSHICNIEKGNMQPEPPTLKKLTDALGENFENAVKRVISKV